MNICIFCFVDSRTISASKYLHCQLDWFSNFINKVKFILESWSACFDVKFARWDQLADPHLKISFLPPIKPPRYFWIIVWQFCRGSLIASPFQSTNWKQMPQIVVILHVFEALVSKKRAALSKHLHLGRRKSDLAIYIVCFELMRKMRRKEETHSVFIYSNDDGWAVAKAIKSNKTGHTIGRSNKTKHSTTPINLMGSFGRCCLNCTQLTSTFNCLNTFPIQTITYLRLFVLRVFTTPIWLTPLVYDPCYTTSGFCNQT